MKKKLRLTLALAACVSLGVSAQPAAKLTSGFYRVQNNKTQRYAYVYDNLGSINYEATSADMGSIVLYKPSFHNRFADPASLCYIEKVAHKHNIHGQNTSLLDIVGHYVQIQDAINSKGEATHKITPLLAGFTIYLQDAISSGYHDKSHVDGPFKSPQDDTYYWDFIPFIPNGDEYLGIAPNEAMEVGGKYYKPYVIGFDMTLLSSGMKAYYVSDVKSDAVIIKEITGTIPYNTPVIIECSSTDPSANRVDVSVTKSPCISDNRLSANYFCYANHGESAYTVYNPQTMRVLKVEKGRLVFGSVDKYDNISTTQLAFAYEEDNVQKYNYEQCLSANSAYLQVPADFPVELSVMTEEEYNSRGDLDGDGFVTLLDLQSAEKGLVPMVLKKIEATDDGDLNGDDYVNIADIAHLINRLISNH